MLYRLPCLLKTQIILLFATALFVPFISNKEEELIVMDAFHCLNINNIYQVLVFYQNWLLCVSNQEQTGTVKQQASSKILCPI